MASVIQLREKAEEMEIPFNEAAFCRFRYVRQQMFVASDEIDQLEDYDFESEAGIINYVRFADALDRLLDLAAEQRALMMNVCQKPRNGSAKITHEQVERARQYPVTQLIEFYRGRALAWCHPDKNPSMYYAPRINKAVCPVCNRYFDSIAIVMGLHNFDFIQAVKHLAA